MDSRRVLEGEVWEGIHGHCMGENHFPSFWLSVCMQTDPLNVGGLVMC